jgi:hypothetical protein
MQNLLEAGPDIAIQINGTQGKEKGRMLAGW